MTRKEAKQLLPIIEAYAEGKTIECRSYDGVWSAVSERADLKFYNGPEDYRIKPEPKYRPFENAEECWAEMQKHQPFGWLKEKSSTSYCLLTAVRCIYIQEGAYGGRFSFIERYKTEKVDNDSPIEHTFELYEFADGQPFGVKVEDD